MIWLYVATALLAGAILLISISATLGWAEAWFARVRRIPGGDKLVHFVLMGGLSLLLNLSLRTRQLRLPVGRVLLGSLALYILVTIDELIQMFLTLRSFDLLDLASNYLGIYVFGRLAIRWSTPHGDAAHKSN